MGHNRQATDYRVEYIHLYLLEQSGEYADTPGNSYKKQASDLWCSGIAGVADFRGEGAPMGFVKEIGLRSCGLAGSMAGCRICCGMTSGTSSTLT